jgi:hypothetical protein
MLDLKWGTMIYAIFLEALCKHEVVEVLRNNFILYIFFESDSWQLFSIRKRKCLHNGDAKEKP